MWVLGRGGVRCCAVGAPSWWGVVLWCSVVVRGGAMRGGGAPRVGPVWARAVWCVVRAAWCGRAVWTAVGAVRGTWCGRAGVRCVVLGVGGRCVVPRVGAVWTRGGCGAWCGRLVRSRCAMRGAPARCVAAVCGVRWAAGVGTVRWAGAVWHEVAPGSRATSADAGERHRPVARRSRIRPGERLCSGKAAALCR